MNSSEQNVHKHLSQDAVELNSQCDTHMQGTALKAFPNYWCALTNTFEETRTMDMLSCDGQQLAELHMADQTANTHKHSLWSGGLHGTTWQMEPPTHSKKDCEVSEKRTESGSKPLETMMRTCVMKEDPCSACDSGTCEMGTSASRSDHYTPKKTKTICKQVTDHHSVIAVDVPEVGAALCRYSEDTMCVDPHGPAALPANESQKSLCQVGTLAKTCVRDITGHGTFHMEVVSLCSAVGTTHGSQQHLDALSERSERYGYNDPHKVAANVLIVRSHGVRVANRLSSGTGECMGNTLSEVTAPEHVLSCGLSDGTDLIATIETVDHPQYETGHDTLLTMLPAGCDPNAMCVGTYVDGSSKDVETHMTPDIEKSSNCLVLAQAVKMLGSVGTVHRTNQNHYSIGDVQTDKYDLSASVSKGRADVEHEDGCQIATLVKESNVKTVESVFGCPVQARQEVKYERPLHCHVG